MTPNESAALRVGMYVTAPHDTPPRRPRRVSAVYTNPATGFTYLRIASIADGWLPANEYDLPPAGEGWDAFAQGWRKPRPDETIVRMSRRLVPRTLRGARG